MKKNFIAFESFRWMIIFIVFFGCKNPYNNNIKQKEVMKTPNDIQIFKSDFDFLNQFTDLVLLEDSYGEGKVLISPALQARVMTSTVNGWSGNSYGWINRDHFISGDTSDHINAFGGEERLWFGPEGGQYSIFFKRGDEFTLDNWFTPHLIDLEPFELINQTKYHALFSKSASLTNYSGFTFDLQIDRAISILSHEEINEILQIKINEKIKSVGYKTENTLKNISNEPWEKKNGLLSIWILGMFNPTPATTVVIPYIGGSELQLGPITNDNYFGKIPSNRLMVDEKAIYYKADGKERGKIGVSPLRASNVFGSFDSEGERLTIIYFNKPENKNDYVNSKWEIQTDPYNGDVINSYNDGPPEPGAKSLGPFYELETSSPAAELGIGNEISHIQYTFHFEGDIKELESIIKKTLGVSLKEIKNKFK